ncbi:LPXTG cell wall anchor domain-containing protein [Lactiplantibacillus songbeiensis]|uniref:LPXTG cell wall anchor domain-containing protein n=1 Tax=Lactiplantibacillus songbeiensis TaxID=2559920 RepID=A0ABW4C5X7_9LACO|nr:LPXTG cell wall anchor domain-containing protein [Lactiplantibacillus songbeiensis]
MRRMSLIGLIGLLLVLGLSPSVWAAQSSQTELSVSFYDDPTTVSGAKLNPGIPDGRTAYRITAQPTTIARHSKTATSTGHFGAWIQAVRHGQLPQTSEYQGVYLGFIGCLLLVISGLLLIIWRQWRQLRKRV